MDEHQIRSKILGRSNADTVIDLLGGDVRDTVMMRSMIDELRKIALPPEPVPEKPKQESLGSLEIVGLPFGKYAGQAFRQTPLEYLDWLCGKQEHFLELLRAYLKHPDNHRTE